MLTEKDRLFCLRYYNEFCYEKSIKLSTLYNEVYEENLTSREGRSKGEALLRKREFKDEIAKYNNIDKVDVANEDSLKEFVKTQLLDIYKKSSTITRKSDRNGKPTEELQFMDSGTTIRSLELLGKSTGLFKDKVEMTDTVWEISSEDEE